MKNLQDNLCPNLGGTKRLSFLVVSTSWFVCVALWLRHQSSVAPKKPTNEETNKHTFWFSVLRFKKHCPVQATHNFLHTCHKGTRETFKTQAFETGNAAGKPELGSCIHHTSQNNWGPVRRRTPEFHFHYIDFFYWCSVKPKQVYVWWNEKPHTWGSVHMDTTTTTRRTRTTDKPKNQQRNSKDLGSFFSTTNSEQF